MDHAAKFRERFSLKKFNNLNDPLDAGRYQHTVFEFMEHVRLNAFRGSKGEELMRDFCTYVNHEKVWHLAEMVVPEFRVTLTEQ